MLILEVGSQPVSAVAFSSDGWHLYAGCEDGALARIGSDGLVDSIGSFHRRVNAIAARPRSDEVYACSENWIATINPESPPGKPAVLDKRNASLTAIAFVSHDILLTGTGHLAKSAGGTACFDDLTHNKTIGKTYNEAGGIRCFATHPHSQSIAWATGDRFVRAMSLLKPDTVKISFDQNANAISFSPDGSHLAVAIGWLVRVVEWKTQRLRSERKGHKGRVTGVQYLPNETILSCSWDDLVTLGDPAGHEIRTFEFGIGKLNCLAVSPDGSRAAAGSVTGKIIIWDVA